MGSDWYYNHATPIKLDHFKHLGENSEIFYPKNSQRNPKM
jgi:hypothetical protein